MMRTNIRAIFLFLLMPLFLLMNCVSVQEPPKYVERAASVEEQQNSSVANRFQEAAMHKPTVVESAMELSQQHAKLSEEAALLRQSRLPSIFLRIIQLAKQSVPRLQCITPHHTRSLTVF